LKNTGAVASDIEVALKALGKEKDIKVIAIGGDGAAMDIGFGAISGSFKRGYGFTISVWTMKPT
jgi:pyruvate ferredoxin oxidoreductase beta subunit